MVKSFAVLFTVFFVLLSLAACSNSDDSIDTPQSTTTTNPFSRRQLLGLGK